MLKVNEAGWDRGLRLGLGVLFGTLALTGSGAWVWLFTALTVVAMATAALGFCPLYALLGLDTCPVKQ